MDSNNNSSGSSNGDIAGHYLRTSTTSPHFFDLPPFHHHDSPSFSFPHLLSSPPPPPPAISTTAQWAKTEPNIVIATSSVGPTRPSKKRSRASRRAPTTVLTTDTSNFRAMVQEFTGIPAPPFSSSTSASTSLHFPRSFNLNPSPLLKPFPHKFQFAASPSEFDFRRNPNSINFQPQLVNLPQPPAPVMNSTNSGAGLDLPGIIGPDRETRKLNFSVPGPISSTATAEFDDVEKGEGLMESWICSSD